MGLVPELTNRWRRLQATRSSIIWTGQCSARKRGEAIFHIIIVYHHGPDDLAAEIATAGFQEVEVVGVQGPIGPWARLDPTLNDHALEIARLAEKTMAGASIHMLAKATKPV